MLTKDIEKVKKNIFETWNKTKTLDMAKKPIQEVKKEDSKKKKTKDPLYQRMVNRAVVKYPYADTEDDAIARYLQDTGFEDHEHMKKMVDIDREIKSQMKDMQSQIDTLKNEITTLKNNNRV
jgi:MoxR-like ATPase